MKVKFIDNVDISGRININKGEIFEAREDGDFIMIRMMDDSTVKAPKSEIEGIVEVEWNGMDKEDMSEYCDFKYNEYWLAANQLHTMPQDEWNQWFDEHCGKCKYMCEICMYGET